MSGYESYFIQILQKEKVKFVREKTYKDLKNGAFRFDFYLTARDVLVEIDGEQHFKPIYGRQNFLKGQEHDRLKNSYCLAKGIKLYRIPYWEIKDIKKVSDIFTEAHLVKSRWHNDYLKVPH
jgi:very-short-patch-repair endonuclease